MTTRAFLVNDQADGVAAVVANMQATDGTRPTLISPGSGGAITFSSEHPDLGPTGLKIVSSSTNAAVARFPFPGTASRTNRFSFKRYLAAPFGAVMQFAAVLNGGTQLFRIGVDASNRVTINRASGGLAATSTEVLATGGKKRFEVSFDTGTTTTDGSCTVLVFDDNATTGPVATVTATGANLGALPATNLDVGITSAAIAGTQWYSTILLNDGSATSMLGPYVPANLVPVVNAGSDQLDLEPYRTVTLTASASDPDGAINATSWTQVAGTPDVPLSGAALVRTFETPGTIDGATLVFRFSATDNVGATTSDDVTVTVQPATERAVIGGVEVPARLAYVKA